MTRRCFLYPTLLLILTGCLPSSCQREEPRALFPSDSLSRQIAETVPVDTLQFLWETAGPEEKTLKYPRTVRFGTDERIYVSDPEHNSIFVFDQAGTFVGEQTAEAFDLPYLAGMRGDTLVVFNPTEPRLDFLVDGSVVRQASIPVELPRRGRLVYATASTDAIYLKVLGQDIDSYIARLSAEGTVEEKVALPGPYWRHAGFLRTWGDSLLSLSGFRPVVDVIPPGGTLDTMALRGFDSPMLARSRAYLKGDVRDAPLLTSSAAPAGPYLFVLNMRPGWLQIDVFDHQGALQHRLTQPDSTYQKKFFPQDLAVRSRGDGRYDLAVVLSEPSPRVVLYRY